MGSRGMDPSKVTPISSHIATAPPVVGGNIFVSCLQLGQINVLIFSTTPKIGMPTFFAKINFLSNI